MPLKYIHRLFSFYPDYSLFLYAKTIILSQLFLAFLLFQGCACLTCRPKPHGYFSSSDIENIMENLKEQGDIITEFYSTGTLTINGWILDQSVDIFIAGKRDPFAIKIEISHSWGKPLLYFLIKEERLEIIDFSEKKEYQGKFSPDNLSRFLPNMDCSPDMIWSYLRGFPYLPSSLRAYEGDAGIVNFENEEGIIIGTIAFSSDKEVKEARSSTPSFPEMKFTDFKKLQNIYYAEKTEVKEAKEDKDMTLKRNRIVFNKAIPEEIFTLKAQPSFEAVNLDEM